MKVLNLTALLFVSLCTGSTVASADAPAASFPLSDGVPAYQIHTLSESREILDRDALERATVPGSLHDVELAEGPMSDNERVQELVTYFKTKNLDLESLLKDERFELYDEILFRFINSAERITHTLEEYKNILNIDTKKVAIREFIQAHQQSLEEAERNYEIPTYVISAIRSEEHTSELQSRG